MKTTHVKEFHIKQVEEIMDLVLTLQFQIFIETIYAQHPDKKQRNREFNAVCDDIQTALEKKVTTNGVRARALMTMLVTVLAATDPNLVNGLTKLKNILDGESPMSHQRDDSDMMVR